VGRDAIVSFMAASWQTSPLKYERYETVALYDTNAPGTIVVEQQVFGASSATGAFVLPNIVVLTVGNGLIQHFRDYVNVLAAAEAMGRAIS
jgi:hypothetical protein